jgi:hypothetical protein
MNPSVDDRMNSVLRALQTVVLPALPQEASLAREQVMIAMGHLQIIQAQRDATPGYEAEELTDILGMARQIVDVEGCDGACASVRETLKRAMQESALPPREAAEAIREAIDALLIVAGQVGTEKYHQKLSQTILPLAQARARKDRSWFAPMGFDIELSA